MGEVIVDTSKISGFLKHMRLDAGLTQLNVAERLGLTPQAVSKWERGESMPDITMLPEIAKIYGIRVEDILAAGITGKDEDLNDITRLLNTFIDDRIFSRVLKEFGKAKGIQDLNVPMDIFMALNGQQKDLVLELLLDMDGFCTIIDDILQYLNMSQRARLITRVAENGDYDTLEQLIPYMSRSVRTDIIAIVLERGRMDFLEEMLLYLNREQKNFIIRYFLENELSLDALEDLLPFFDKAQRDLIMKLEDSQWASQK